MNNEKNKVNSEITINLRRCISCYERKPKGELLKVVRNAGGTIEYDVSGKKNGRGAYVCRDEKCVAKALKEKRFERAFKKSIPQDIREILERELRQGGLLDGDHQ